MVDTKQAMWVYRVARNFKFLRLFIFADWAFCYEARVWRDCDQRWRDSTPFKFCDYINSFPRLSDFTDCGVKHSKYSIKLTTYN